MRYSLCLWIILLLVCNGLCDDDLQKSIGPDRKLINNYALDLTFKIKDRSDVVPSGFVEETVQYQVWKQGDLSRTDVLKIKSNFDQKNVGTRRVFCENCERQGYLLDASILKESINRVTFTKLTEKDLASNQVDADWINLGFDVKFNFDARKKPKSALDIIFGLENLTEETVTRDGVAHKKISAIAKSQHKWEVWLRPDQEMNPVRYELTDGQGRLILESSINYQLTAGQQIWFPKNFKHSLFMNGNLQLEQSITVNSMKCNQGIEPEVFQFASMGLRFGTPIKFPESKRLEDEPTWRDGQLDYVNNAKKQAHDSWVLMMSREAIPDEKPTPRIWYAAASLIFLLAGCILFVVYRRRANASPR